MSSKTGKIDVTKLDLYGIIGVTEDASEKEIIKSYRKQALKCHPDKNPDNPNAADQFHKLTKALEVLTDAAAKAAYDKILKSKKAAEIRHRHYDAKRKKFKEDLEARESAARTQTEDSASAARNLHAEIERLRKEGSRILEQVQEQLEEDLRQAASRVVLEDESGSDSEDTTAKLKAKWKIKKGEVALSYTKEELEKIFSKYGEILNLLVSIKKSGTAIVEFASVHAAEAAMKCETGKPDCPLTLTWLQGQPSERSTTNGAQACHTNSCIGTDPITSSFPSFSQPEAYSNVSASSNRDFESVVLMKMRQAEERKRLIEQMQRDEDDNNG